MLIICIYLTEEIKKKMEEAIFVNPGMMLMKERTSGTTGSMCIHE